MMTPFPSSPAPTLQATASSFGDLDLRENFVAPIGVDDVFDDLDAEAGLVWRVHVPVPMLEGLAHQVVLQRVAERLQLEQLACRGAEADRQTGGCSDRRRPGMGVGLTVVVFDAVSDLLEARDPFGTPGVDTDDIHGPGLKDPLVTLEVPFLLAIRDEGGRLATQVRVTLRIPRAERLLYPGEVVLLERLDATDGGYDVPLNRPAAVDHDLGARAEALAHPPHVLDIPVVFVSEPRIPALPEPDLHAAQTGGEPLLGLLDHPADVLVVGVARSDRGELLVDGAPEKLDDRRAEELAFDVPEGYVDRAYREARDAAVVPVPPGLIAQRLPDRVRVERVGADDALGHSFDDRLRREARLGELGDRFAPADDPVVRGDLHQTEVTKRVEVIRLRIADRNRFDLDDLRHRDLRAGLEAVLFPTHRMPPSAGRSLHLLTPAVGAG